jgi:hypothetical protein
MICLYPRLEYQALYSGDSVAVTRSCAVHADMPLERPVIVISSQKIARKLGLLADTTRGFPQTFQANVAAEPPVLCCPSYCHVIRFVQGQKEHKCGNLQQCVYLYNFVSLNGALGLSMLLNRRSFVWLFHQLNVLPSFRSVINFGCKTSFDAL